MEFRRAFEPFEEAIPGDATLRRAKVLYLTIYGAVFLVALWKTWQLGVFPITPADLVRFRSGLIASFVFVLMVLHVDQSCVDDKRCCGNDWYE